MQRVRETVTECSVRLLSSPQFMLGCLPRTSEAWWVVQPGSRCHQNIRPRAPVSFPWPETETHTLRMARTLRTPPPPCDAPSVSDQKLSHFMTGWDNVAQRNRSYHRASLERRSVGASWSGYPFSLAVFNEVPTSPGRGARVGLDVAWVQRDRWYQDRGGMDITSNHFRLALELKYCDLDPTPANLAAVFRRHPGWDRGAVLAEVQEYWDAVTTTPERNALTAAMKAAGEQWQEFEVWGVKGTRAKCLALVWWLHYFAPRREFIIVPRDKIADWLGVSDKTAGRILRELNDGGLIRFRDGGEYRYTAKEAREAEFLGFGEEPKKRIVTIVNLSPDSQLVLNQLPLRPEPQAPGSAPRRFASRPPSHDREEPERPPGRTADGSTWRTCGEAGSDSMQEHSPSRTPRRSLSCRRGDGTHRPAVGVRCPYDDSVATEEPSKPLTHASLESVPRDPGPG